jgi:hypothetical protein
VVLLNSGLAPDSIPDSNRNACTFVSLQPKSKCLALVQTTSVQVEFRRLTVAFGSTAVRGKKQLHFLVWPSCYEPV